jgi:hypothetical protein
LNLLRGVPYYSWFDAGLLTEKCSLPSTFLTNLL